MAPNAVKFVSERFIHIENFEMDFEEAEEKNANEGKVNCEVCLKMKSFLVKMN